MPNENAEGAQGKAEDAQELSAEQESAETVAEPDGAGVEDAQDAGSGKGSDDEPEDKHGQPGINREKYRRDIAERDAKIAELSAKVDEAAKSADAREKLKQEIEELLGGGGSEELSRPARTRASRSTRRWLQRAERLARIGVAFRAARRVRARRRASMSREDAYDRG